MNTPALNLERLASILTPLSPLAASAMYIAAACEALGCEEETHECLDQFAQGMIERIAQADKREAN